MDTNTPTENKQHGILYVLGARPSSTVRLQGVCRHHAQQPRLVGKEVTTSSIQRFFQVEDTWHAETRNTVYQLAWGDAFGLAFLQNHYPSLFSQPQ